MSLTTISSGVSGIVLKNMSRSESLAPLVTGSGYVPRTGLKVVTSIKIFFLQGNKPRGAQPTQQNCITQNKTVFLISSIQAIERTYIGLHVVSRNGGDWNLWKSSSVYSRRRRCIVLGPNRCINLYHSENFNRIIKKGKVGRGRTCSKHHKKNF